MEYRDLLDSNRNLTGEKLLVGNKIPEGYNILVVITIIQNKAGEFLIQRRSLNRGNKWALTSGHPKSGETSIQGIITEVKEEIGVDISNQDIKLFKSNYIQPKFADLYYINMEIDLKDTKLQEEEVQDLKWATLDEVMELINNGEFHKTHEKVFMEYLEYASVLN